MKIFDGHNDILNKITKTEDPLNPDAFLKGGEGHLDFPRACNAEFAGGFFSVYPSNPPAVPSPEARTVFTESGYSVTMAPPLEYDYALQSALGMIDLLYKIESQSEDQFAIVSKFQDLKDCFENGSMAAVLHLEGAEPILPSLENLDFFYSKGMRSLGITWSRPNAFGYGVPFRYPSSPDTGPGLTEAGKNLVHACNQMGILVDLAHLNQRGFWDVAEICTAPLVSTHTAACSLAQKARNLTDDQLIAIGETNGVVGIIFSVNDLDGNRRPKDDGPISSIVRHLNYIAELIGPQHVAFGSDLDGTYISSELGDVGGFPRLIQLLDEAGFSSEELEGICFRNWMRVLKDTWIND